MTAPERRDLEQQVRDLLATDLDSITMSNRLYAQGTGLFSRLGTTRELRDEIIRSPLWAEARTRVRELERRDLLRFAEAAGRLAAPSPGQGVAG